MASFAIPLASMHRRCGLAAGVSSMRIVIIVLAVLVIALGALFGALNPAALVVNLYFAELRVPTGVALLGCLLLGWLLRGAVFWFAQNARLRRDVRNLRRQLDEARRAAADPAARSAA
jgi:uncharacterized integral membrane protein